MSKITRTVSLLAKCAMRRTRDTGWASVFTRMEGTLKALGKMTSATVRAMKNSAMETFTKGSTTTAKCQEKVSIIGPMAISMMESGVRAKSMEMGCGAINLGILISVNG